MCNNFFLHSAVLNPLLLFVFCLMPYAVCTFVLYYFHMQLMCLPDLRSNLKFAERQDYVRQAIDALAGKSCWHLILWKDKTIGQIKYCLG